MTQMTTNRSARRDNKYDSELKVTKQQREGKRVDMHLKEKNGIDTNDTYKTAEKERVTPGMLKELINHKADYSLSIYLKTHTSGAQIREDPLHLKNIVEQLEKKLCKDLRTPEVDELLTPLKELIADASFWEYQKEGLVLFRSKDYFTFLRVGASFEEMYEVAPEFYIKPLLPLITDDTTFYILAISKKFTALYSADHEQIRYFDVPDMPDNIEDALWYKKIQNDGGFHTKTQNGMGHQNPALYYGSGEWKDKDKLFLTEYFRKIDTSIHPYISHTTYPLILASVESFLPLYKNATTYPHLVSEVIHGNPEELSARELHTKAWSIMQTIVQHKQKEMIESYKNLIGSDRFISELQSIVPAASDGLIETLFVDKNDLEWGRYDLKKRVLYTDKKDTVTNDDLLNIATIQTLKNSGKVFVLSPDEMPVSTHAAAVLRYSPHL